MEVDYDVKKLFYSMTYTFNDDCDGFCWKRTSD